MFLCQQRLLAPSVPYGTRQGLTGVPFLRKPEQATQPNAFSSDGKTVWILFSRLSNNQEPHFLICCWIFHLGRKKSWALPALSKAAAPSPTRCWMSFLDKLYFSSTTRKWWRSTLGYVQGNLPFSSSSSLSTSLRYLPANCSLASP